MCPYAFLIKLILDICDKKIAAQLAKGRSLLKKILDFGGEPLIAVRLFVIYIIPRHAPFVKRADADIRRVIARREN